MWCLRIRDAKWGAFRIMNLKRVPQDHELKMGCLWIKNYKMGCLGSTNVKWGLTRSFFLVLWGLTRSWLESRASQDHASKKGRDKIKNC